MKKILSTILTVAILCTAFFQIIPTSAATDSNADIWDSSVAANGYSDGEGTAEKPYIITTGAELYKAIKTDKGKKDDAKAYYKLANDIYLNDVSQDNWYEGTGLNSWFSTDNSSTNGFIGSIDGDGYTVYGLYYNGNANINAGLIPSASGNAEIKNINIRNAFIKNTYNTANTATAAILGIAVGGEGTITVSGCSGDETVILNGSNASNRSVFVSGIVAYASSNRTLEIEDCYFITASGNITKSGNSGSDSAGLFCNSYNSAAIKISTSYTVNIKPVSSKISSASTFSVNNVYTNVTGVPHGNVLSDDNMKDAAAEANMAGFDFTNTWTTLDNAYPKLRIDKTVSIDDSEIWGGSSEEAEPFEGDGTSDSPYLIKTGAQLYKAIKTDKGLKDDAKAYYKLANDIYLNDVSEDNWYEGTGVNSWFGNSTAAANGFAGCFDGDGYTIYGVYFKDSSKECAGLFPTVNSGAEIKNINLRKAYINNLNAGSNTYTGGILGLKPGGTDATVSGCSGDETVFVLGSLTGTKNYDAGGLVGGASSGTLTIKDCYFIAGTDTVLSITRTAGLIADSWGTLVVNTSYSVNIAPLKKVPNSATTAKHIYTNVEGAERANYIADANMKGAAAVANMGSLGYEAFYANDGYPLFRVNGERISDVNGDGLSDTNDITAMRKYLLEDSEEVLACRLSVNGDEAVDIRDLFRLVVNANAE